MIGAQQVVVEQDECCSNQELIMHVLSVDQNVTIYVNDLPMNVAAVVKATCFQNGQAVAGMIHRTKLNEENELPIH